MVFGVCAAEANEWDDAERTNGEAKVNNEQMYTTLNTTDNNTVTGYDSSQQQV